MSNATINTNQNRFTRHCAVVPLRDILPGRVLREIPARRSPLSRLPPFGGRERVEDVTPAGRMPGRQAGK